MQSNSDKSLSELLTNAKKELEQIVVNEKERELAALYIVMKVGYLTSSGVIDRLSGKHKSTYYDILGFEIQIDRKSYSKKLQELIIKFEVEKYGPQSHFIHGPSHDFIFEAHDKEKDFMGHTVSR